jgi:hypothetical protein
MSHELISVWGRPLVRRLLDGKGVRMEVNLTPFEPPVVIGPTDPRLPEPLKIDPSDFDRYSIVIAGDFNGDPVATVFANGYPVLVVAAEDTLDGESSVEVPSMGDSGAQAQAYAGLLERIGEADEEFGTIVAEKGLYKAQDEGEGVVGDGHEWCALIDEVREVVRRHEGR